MITEMDILCKNCCKSKEGHFSCNYIPNPFWCTVSGRELYETLMNSHATYITLEAVAKYISYKPMDNLDYVEYEAQRRNLI